MKNIDNPKALTREALALQAFSWARNLIPLVRQQKDSETRTILFGSLCIYYSRPFTNSNGFGMISDSVIPQALKATHQKVINYRHTIIAHSDISAEVNRIYFRSDGNSLLFENRHKAPTVQHLADVEVLINTVYDKTNKRIDECLNEGVPKTIVYDTGLYQLSITDAENWIEKIEDDGLG